MGDRHHFEFDPDRGIRRRVIETLEASPLLELVEGIVAHHEQGTVNRFRATDTLNGEPVLPGFACPVADILGDH